jgi:hypothetical protein
LGFSPRKPLQRECNTERRKTWHAIRPQHLGSPPRRDASHCARDYDAGMICLAVARGRPDKSKANTEV